MPSVDVVVPCYRYAHFLPAAVESVLSQEGVEVSVHIIDDASPDDTEAVGRRLAAADCRVSIARHAENKGHIATYNEGLSAATADYCLLLSADDLLLPGALSRATAALAEAPHAGFAFGGADLSFPDGRVEPLTPLGRRAKDRILSGRDFIRRCGAQNIVPTPTAVVRTSLQHEVGYYDPALPHAGDMEMWLRLAARADVAFIAAPQAVYRMHQTNMSLGYSGDRLPDLVQRRAGFDAFLRNSGLGDLPRLRSHFERRLAEDALADAIGAEEAGRSEMAARLEDFAEELSPLVYLSRQGVKRLAQRAVGATNWRRLKAAVAR